MTGARKARRVLLAVPAVYARRQWRARFGSLVALAALIAIGTAVTLTALAGARRSSTVVRRFTARDRTADVIVDAGNASPALRHQIATLPGVAEASQLSNTATFPTGTDQYIPLLASIDGRAGFTMQRGVVIDGRRANPHAVDQVMLSESSARVLRKHAGDDIIARTFTPAERRMCLGTQAAPDSCDAVFAHPHGPNLRLRVVGILRTGPDLRNRANEISISFLTPAFYDRYGSTLASDAIIAVRLRDPARRDAFVAAAQHVIPPGTDVTFDATNTSPVDDAVRVLTIGLLAFALVAGVASTVAVGQAVLRHVAADAGDRHVLRALGATRRDRYAAAALTVLPAVLAGLAVGCAVAFTSSAFMPLGLARKVEPSRGLQFDGLILGGAVVIVALAIFTMTLLAAWLTDGRVPARHSRHARIAAPAIGTHAPRAIGLRYALAPGKGALPARTAMAAIATATAGVVAVLGLGAGLHHLVHTPSLYGWTFDVIGVDESHIDAVKADHDVAWIMKYRAQIPLRVGNAPALGFALQPVSGNVELPIVAGHAPRRVNEAALGADTMSHAHVHIGDSVQVGGVKGKRQMRVVGQAVFPTDSDAYPLADGILVHPDAVAVLGPSDSFQGLGVKVRKGASSDVYRRLSRFSAGGPLSRPAPPSEIEKLEQVESLPRLLAAFLIVLGMFAVAHALVVNVRRRRRDFGVLRALGFRSRDVGMTVTWQAAALAIGGVLIGLPVGLLLGRVVWTQIATSIGVRVVHEVPVAAVVLVVPAALLVSVGTALVPARRAARMRPTELLRSE